MTGMTELQIGDVVRFDESFHSDAHCYMSIVQCNPVLDQLCKNTIGVDGFGDWFARLEATVINFHHGDLIELEVEMMFQTVYFSCWECELIPTGKRKVSDNQLRMF